MTKFQEECLSMIEALFDLTRKFATAIARGKMSGDQRKEIAWKLEWIAGRLKGLKDEG